jgi:putative ABC transport system permease protein
LSPLVYSGKDVRSAFYDPLLEKVRAIPGIKNAGVIQWIPVENWGWNSDTHIVGKPTAEPNTEQLAEWRCVTSGYFNTMGIRLMRGRLLDSNIDTAASPRVAVVNEAFVRKFFAAGEDPIGQHIEWENRPAIIGVVSDVRQNIYQPAMAEIDYSMSQFAPEDLSLFAFSMQLVARTSREPSDIVPELRRTFQEVDPTLPFRQPETMAEVVSHVLILERLENWLFGVFAALAVLLAVVGLYGLISHEVELSVRDIGLRLALGATRVQVLSDVYRRVGGLLAIGVTAGLSMTLVLRKLLAAIIVIRVGHDFGVITALAMGLACLGVLAASVPAWRAASTDPIEALRYE